MAPGKKHLELQKRSLAWIRSRVTGKGFRAGWEVRLGNQYVADVVALGNLQLGHDLEYWANHHKGPLCNHRHDERHYEQVFVFEAKATRADFLSTFGGFKGYYSNRYQPIGTHHWIVTAKGIVKPEEMGRLNFWGLLIESGSGLREIRPPYWCNIERQRILEIAHTILWK